MKPDGTGLAQLTHHKDYDVKSPSTHGGKIVYQHNGYVNGNEEELFEKLKSL